MGEAFKAYSLHTVIAETSKKVTAIEGYADGVFVGLADGSLLRLVPGSDPVAASEPWQVARIHKAFAKKTVTALKASWPVSTRMPN